MSRFQKAMVWLGLTDAIEEDDDYEDNAEDSPRRARHYKPDGQVGSPASRVQIYQNQPEFRRGEREKIRYIAQEEQFRSGDGFSDGQDPYFRDSRPGAEPPHKVNFVKPVPAEKPKLHLSNPERFSDVQEIGDRFKERQVVVVELNMVSRELQRRIIDFCSGVTYAMDGKIEKLADDLLLLSPAGIELGANDREKLMQRLRPGNENQ